jgi:hypothetical protein
MKTAKVRYKKSESIKRLEDYALKKLKEKYPNFPYHVKPTYKDNTTNALTKCVVDAIELTGGFVERVNSMGNKVKTTKGTKWVKGSSKKGTADLHCIIKTKSVKIEIKCKYTNDRQSEFQKEYQKEIEKAGGVYLIVTTFDDFYNWYRSFIKKR